LKTAAKSEPFQPVIQILHVIKYIDLLLLST